VGAARLIRASQQQAKVGSARVRDFTVSVAEILGHPGEYRDVAVAHGLDGVEVPLARLSPRPLSGSLRLESVIEGVLVTGTVAGATALQCARCLEAFGSTVEADVCELYTAPGHEAEDDAYRVTGTDIDLEPMLRDTVGLALPLNPLCRADCAGLCARCGKDLNDGACDCVEDETDPRWDALGELRAKLESQSG
jgi:uncharacterized protein